ncbi:MAG TPA: hypothetical protein VEF89_16175 [Solirubrobacteraceae bacterium]|nr:hypothetical protein [Solirubrobacteraceae bacterium]
MTDARCTPVPAPLTVWEREQRADRMADLLECLADLLVQTDEQRLAIERATDRADAPAQRAVERLAELQRTLRQIGLEAAAVHQLLQHEHLI